MLLVGGVAPESAREILAKSPPYKSSKNGCSPSETSVFSYGRCARFKVFNVSRALKRPFKRVCMHTHLLSCTATHY